MYGARGQCWPWTAYPACIATNITIIVIVRLFSIVISTCETLDYVSAEHTSLCRRSTRVCVGAAHECVGTAHESESAQHTSL